MKNKQWAWTGILGSAVLGLLAATPALGDSEGLHVIQGGPSYFNIGLGAFNAAGVTPGPGYTNATLPEINLEYQTGAKLFGIGAVYGLMANTNGGFMGYTGFYTDVAWDHWVLTPVLAMGGYHQGRGKYLDGTFQFRLELSLDYQFANQSRFGLKIAHISNAYIKDSDPGEDEIMLNYSMPLSFGEHS
ncbi:acyloxyacyl hydrolase [Acidithiobacillus thiooxidans]|uniref:acyloxyacyl hydrolase n=1 Tax=Acidithiobacillus TaxID=119977 RepID=UPI0002624B9D|nr:MULTISPECIES: acyloxyacyl hydrolase [Acidithiobacillus]MBU2810283.1 acyloxyacyl hydrolase [Acidithiobacillus thiooxidans]MDA8176526.1 acyloxyacyl hydrolase [Acidithiobacillus sp.]